ncbi:hypothetical protein M0804_006365 [Polistes exclamans]|nr:hypothetical protein M0804_006365 [Polistes exclamans]
MVMVVRDGSGGSVLVMMVIVVAKSMCSEMATELRFALDCGNGNKKISKKTQRQRQRSNLSILSEEEGGYAACSRYTHFVGKAPLT